MNWNQRDLILCRRLQLLQEYHTLPFYMLRRIPGIEFALMERIYNNLSLVKMPHSSFKRKVTDNGAGVGRCPCGHTFECASERELAMKHRIHCRFCSNPSLAFDKIGVSKKAATLREQQINEAERIRKVHS